MIVWSGWKDAVHSNTCGAGKGEWGEVVVNKLEIIQKAICNKIRLVPAAASAVTLLFEGRRQRQSSQDRNTSQG